MPLNLFSLTGLKTLLAKIWPWLVCIVATIALYLFIQHKWHQSMTERYNAGVLDGKLAVVTDYEAKAAILRGQLASDKEEIERNAKSQKDAAEADAAFARATSDRLFAELNKVRGITNNAGVTIAPGTSTAKAVSMLADMLEESIRRGDEMAKFADDAYNAGTTCEIQYDKLRSRILEQQTTQRSTITGTR